MVKQKVTFEIFLLVAFSHAGRKFALIMIVPTYFQELDHFTLLFLRLSLIVYIPCIYKGLRYFYSRFIQNQLEGKVKVFYIKEGLYRKTPEVRKAKKSESQCRRNCYSPYLMD